MYVIASADSEAENLVCEPISLAFDLNASKSFPVAPEIAATFDMEESKSAVVFTAAVPRPRTGTVTDFVKVLPAEDILFPTFCMD